MKRAFSEVSPAFNLLMGCLIIVMCMWNDLLIGEYTPLSIKHSSQIPHNFIILFFFMLWYFYVPLKSSRTTFCTNKMHHWMAHKYLYWTHKTTHLSLKLVTYTCMPNVPCKSTVLGYIPLYFRLKRMRHEKPTAYTWQTFKPGDLCRPVGPLSSQHWIY